MPITLENYINGGFYPPVNGKYLKSENPATTEVLNLVPDSVAEDAEAAIDAAETAFKTWSKTSVKTRSDFLLKIADAIEAEMDSLVAAESADQGKPVGLARMVDIPRAAYNFRFFGQNILHETSKCSHARWTKNEDCLPFSY